MLHTCVRVQNLEESIRFYEEAFGLKKLTEKTSQNTNLHRLLSIRR